MSQIAIDALLRKRGLCVEEVQRRNHDMALYLKQEEEAKDMARLRREQFEIQKERRDLLLSQIGELDAAIEKLK